MSKQKVLSGLILLGILLLGIFLLTIFFQQPEDSEPLDLGQIAEVSEKWTGDYRQMVKRRTIRALVVYNKMFYFLDKGTQRGVSADLLKEFESFINKKEQTDELKIRVIIIPVARDQLIPALREGYGDIGLANLTITEQRKQWVSFSDPEISQVTEVIVTGVEVEPMTSLNDLSGKIIHVRKSSSYYESLIKLNERLEGDGLAKVEIVPFDENLEDSDFLEMINAGLIAITVVDNHKVQFWRQIFDHIRVYENLVVREGGNTGWVFRKNSPELAGVVNEFIGQSKKGTLLGNMLFNRYLKENKWVKNSLESSELEKFSAIISLFEKYGEQYDFPWLMLGALAYQESGLDQDARSAAGAIGIMQILPRTAADKNVNIQDIEKIENNIHAGTKYLRFLKDRYFSSEEIDPQNQILLTFAAYNAGPARVAKLRTEAIEMGLNPNLWFNHVEVVAAKRIGRETVQYVGNIHKYYIAYRMIMPKLLARQSLRTEDE